MAQLRMKELQDAMAREKDAEKLQKMLVNKHHLQAQISEMQQKEADAKMEYLKERDQVDTVVLRMIDEDRESARIMALKQQQAQADMILSHNEKQALIRRTQEMEAYENEMVRRYAEQQQSRLNQIQAAKDEVEAARDMIFKKLEQEELERRAEQQF